MKLHTTLRHRAALIGSLLMVSVSTAALAQEEVVMPSVYQDGNVVYTTGGIGDEERAGLESTQGNYNLRITNAVADGAFASNNQIFLYDKRGNEIVGEQAGPLFYARLPAGSYTVLSQHNGLQQKKTVKLGRRPTDLHFTW